MKVILQDVRLAFPNLYTKDQFGRYGGSFIFSKDSDAYAKVAKAIKAIVDDKFQGKKPSQVCLRNGDERSQYAGYEGNWYVNASRQLPFREALFDRKKRVLDEDDGTFYAGCHVNVALELWAQDNQYGKKVNANVLWVQFVSDDEPFGRKESVVDLDEVPELDDADDDDLPF